MVNNAIAFIAGNNEEEDSLSSGEVVECDSDCSKCASNSLSVGSSSHKHSKVSRQSKPLDAQVESQQNSKRLKRNSSGSIEEEEVVVLKQASDSKRGKLVSLSICSIGVPSSQGSPQEAQTQ